MSLQMFIHPEDGRVHSEVQSPIDFQLIDSKREGAGQRLHALVSQPIPFDHAIEERILRRHAFNQDIRCCILDWVLCLLTIGICSITECNAVELKMEKEIEVARPVVIQKLIDAGLRTSDFTIVDCEYSKSSDPALYFLMVYFNILQNENSPVDLIKAAQIEEYKRQEQKHHAQGVRLATGSYDVVGLNRFEFDRAAKARQKWMALEAELEVTTTSADGSKEHEAENSERKRTKNMMDEKKFEGIIEGLRNNDAEYKHLDLSGIFGCPKIGDEGAILLAEVLQENTSVQKLDLERANITDEGAARLADALTENTTLKYLDLYGNRIGDAAAKNLGEAIVRNSSLKRLELSSNRIGDVGAKNLGEAIGWNSSLKKLLLWRNEIGNEGVAALATGLSTNSTLERLDLSLNPDITYSSQEMKAIRSKLKFNRRSK